MIVWRAFWRMIFGPRLKHVVAVWSDGKKIPVGFFASWWLKRPPHLLVRLEWDGTTIWERTR